jgi:TolB-like protein/DNA-binding winged helix-turn-helix (wHTH) protein
MIDGTVAFGPYRLDLARRVLTVNGKRVVLGGRARDILCALAEAGGEPIEKDALLAKIWPGSDVGDNNLHVHIAGLRKLLGDAGRTHLVTLPGFGYRLLTSAVPIIAMRPSCDGPILGVIPFRSLSADGKTRRFADSFTDDLITQLARSRALRVVADGSFFPEGSDARGTGEHFGANYMLEGSVRAISNGTRINARLIDVASGKYLWAHQYDMTPADCGEIHDDIANLLAAGIDLVVGNLSPVFDSILEKAMGLCGAASGEFFTVEGERFQLVGTRGVPPALTEFRKSVPFLYQPGSNTAQLRAGAEHVHFVDIVESEGYRTGIPNRRAWHELGGARTTLVIALRRGASLVGAIMIYRQEVRPFSDKHATLLRNFAAQTASAL